MRSGKPYLILLAILLLATVLRAYRLDGFSLRGDESFTVLFVQKPFAQMWQETLTVEPNPPLLYLLLRGWIALAGESEFVTRFFSLFFGVLCVPLVYRLAREIFFKTPVALLAAFLIAINPYQIWHSQDVRNYTLWPALSLLALLFFWQWYRRSDGYRVHFSASVPSAGSRWSLPLFVLAELGALYVHYYEAFLLVALNLFVFATTWRDRKRLFAWIGAQVVLAVLYLPYPLILSNRVSAYGEGSGRQGVALWEIARETFSAFVLSDTVHQAARAWLWLPFALLALAGLIVLFTRDGRRGLFFALYAGVPTLAVFALNTVRPLYLERYLNAIAPAYYMLLAFGIVTLSDSVRARVAPSFSRAASLLVRGAAVAALMVAAFFALSNYWTNPAFAKAPDWRGLAAIINTNAQPGDLIVQNFPETSLLYYDKSKLPLVVYPETYLPDTETARQLNAMNANFKRVWFIPAAPDVWDPEQFVEKWLDVRGDLLQEYEAGDFRLRSYATPSSYLDAMKRADVTFGEAFQLLGFRSARTGNRVEIVLYWRALENPRASYTIGVQLADLAGNILAQDKNIPVRGAFSTDLWRKNQIVVDQHELDLPAGAQVFRVNICDAVSGDCLAMTESPTPIGRDYFRFE